ncbi:inositol -trisphosphate receptor-interacting 1 [Limosa lapponica baueri]|uniref:Inositol-trisphosphate receptor-interacting 1 n=1 Tax=Limosa lapponica baueri TaxID=1758121 RepID=A0A2I0UGJ4_LIMLA|nr:inositol -trisphosphate receptor-interacting 1 [Limosa lapponica baueri]
MFATIALLVAVLALQAMVKNQQQRDVATARQTEQREDYLLQQMTQLMQEIKQNSGVEEATFLYELLPVLISTLVEALVLVTVVIWIVRKMDLATDLCHEQANSSSENDKDKEDEDLSGAPSGVRSLPLCTPSPTHGLPDTCKVLKELMDDLLCVCRSLCKRSLLPQMHPAIGMDGPCEEWSVQENSITYRLLVCLQPPPGHSFIMEQDTTGQLPASPSRVRVVLECVCSREQLLRGERLCFLHHPNNDLPRDQSSCCLSTLCTDSYLDLEKVTCWVQELVRSAWLLLPESRHCQLTVLPSSQSCRFQLTGSSRMDIFTEIIFTVERGSSGAHLSPDQAKGSFSN